MVQRAKSPSFQERGEVRLLAALAFLSGLVDVIGWLSFNGLFTAHVTGNLVILAAGWSRGAPLAVAPVLAVPVFAMGAAAGSVLAGTATGRASRVAVLGAQSGLLLLVIVLQASPASPAPWLRLPLVAAMLAVAAMGLQGAFVRGVLGQRQGTSFMTGTLITLALATAALLRPGPWSREEARRRLRVSGPVFLAFLAACPLGAAGVSRLGTTWVWAIPFVASLTAFPLARQLEP